MSGDFAPTHLQRGLHLQRVRRHTEAEAAFREALQFDPDNDLALHHLAISQWNLPGKEREAYQTIKQAIRIAPNDSDHHALAALMVAALDDAKRGLTSAEEAVRLDPTSAFAWYVRAQILLALKRLPEAESAARTALGHDPDHSGAANVLSHALRMQGRLAENAQQIAAMLERDPSDDATHAAAGWNALQARQYAQAQVHFREALRLDPESEYAREGLIEAFRARSRLYRVYLRWALWIQSKNRNMQWGIIIGMFVIAKFSRALFQGPLMPLAVLITAAYFLFVMWVHVARGVGNLMLVTDRFARHALHRAEKIEGWVVGGFVVASLVFAALGALTGFLPLIVLGITLLAAAIPFSYTFTNKAPAGRWIFGAIGVYVVVIGLLFSAYPWIQFFPKEKMGELALSAILISVLSTWLCNADSLRR